MRSRWFLLAGVAVLALGGACSRRLLTRFPHQQHLSELECGVPGKPDCLSCNSCHSGAPDLAQTWAKPPQAVCAECHEAKEDAEKYAVSLRPALASRPAAYDILFGHDQHLAMPEIKGQCVKCHAGAVQRWAASPCSPP